MPHAIALTRPSPYSERQWLGEFHQPSAIFGAVQKLLANTGSDLKHLAKATYYVASDDASNRLNEIRPRLYDPARPPAASKAMVTGTGIKGRKITLDMIAVKKPALAE